MIEAQKSRKNYEINPIKQNQVGMALSQRGMKPGAVPVLFLGQLKNKFSEGQIFIISAQIY